MNRKDFLKLLGAAPFVGLAKYMPEIPPVTSGYIATGHSTDCFIDACVTTKDQCNEWAVSLVNNTDRDIVANSFSVSDDFTIEVECEETHP